MAADEKTRHLFKRFEVQRGSDRTFIRTGARPKVRSMQVIVVAIAERITRRAHAHAVMIDLIARIETRGVVRNAALRLADRDIRREPPLELLQIGDWRNGALGRERCLLGEGVHTRVGPARRSERRSRGIKILERFLDDRLHRSKIRRLPLVAAKIRSIVSDGEEHSVPRWPLLSLLTRQSTLQSEPRSSEDQTKARDPSDLCPDGQER